MARIFRDKCSIVLHPSKGLMLRKDMNGAFSGANAAECFKRLQALAKEKKAPIDTWAIFQPEPENKAPRTPIMLANKWGQPYLALLVATPGKAPAAKRKPVVVKLA